MSALGGWSYNSLTCITGFETRSTLIPPFDAVSTGNLPSNSSIDTVNFAPGGSKASLKLTNTGGSTGEHGRYITLPLSQNMSGSGTFAIMYTSGLGSGHKFGFHNWHSSVVFGDALGIANVAGNIKAAYLYGSSLTSIAWSSTTNLVAGTWYYLQYKQTTPDITVKTKYTVQCRLYDSTGVFIEDSGIVAYTSSSIGWGSYASPCIAMYAPSGDNIVFNIDDVCLAQDGAWAPKYVKIVGQTPVAESAIDTGWLDMSGGTGKVNEVKETPPDGDTTFIQRKLTATATEGFTLTASNITLGANEKILAVATFADVAVHGENTIGFDAASNSGYQASLSTYTWNHTCTGSNKLLLVNVSIFATGSVSSITYNGLALTKITSVSDGTGVYTDEMWYKIAPASGSNAIVVTLNTSLTSIASAASYTGCEQISLGPEAKITASGIGTPASLTVTSVRDNDWIVDGISTSNTAITASQTQRDNNSGALGSGAMQDTNGPKTPAGAQAMSWSWTGALNPWAYIGVAIKPLNKSALFRGAIRIAGSGSLTSVSISPPATSDSYVYAINFLPAPASGYTVANVDGAEAGVLSFFSNSLDRRCTQIIFESAYGVEDYDQDVNNFTSAVMQPDYSPWRKGRGGYLSYVSNPITAGSVVVATAAQWVKMTASDFWGSVF